MKTATGLLLLIAGWRASPAAELHITARDAAGHARYERTTNRSGRVDLARLVHERKAAFGNRKPVLELRFTPTAIRGTIGRSTRGTRPARYETIWWSRRYSRSSSGRPFDRVHMAASQQLHRRDGLEYPRFCFTRRPRRVSSALEALRIPPNAWSAGYRRSGSGTSSPFASPCCTRWNTCSATGKPKLRLSPFARAAADARRRGDETDRAAVGNARVFHAMPMDRHRREHDTSDERRPGERPGQRRG